MLKTFLLTLFLSLGVATPVSGGWVIVLQDELQEPTLDKLIDWIPEEVPRTVSFYFDTDADGKFDIKIAYSLIEAFPCRKNCVSKITDKGDHWLLPAPGINYYVIKKWIMYRYFDDESWRGAITTNDWIFENPLYEDWLEHEYYPLWPEQRMK